MVSFRSESDSSVVDDSALGLRVNHGRANREFPSGDQSLLMGDALPGAYDPQLRKLRGVVLLGGTVRGTALRTAIGRSVMDLPVETGRTLLDDWREQCVALARAMNIKGLPVRLILDRAAPEPRHGWVADERVVLSVERDPIEYRGTGGVLRDLVPCYEPDDFLIVGNAAQLLRAGLPQLAGALSAVCTDAAVISHADGTPSGLMMVRCQCLAELPSVGFVDMKEQALPSIAKRHHVQVVQWPRASGLPVRTLADYIKALRRHHLDLAGVDEAAAPLEEWRPAFVIAEDAAEVRPGARIHNSVVLNGARVEEGAVVVGSVVCGGAVVRRGRMAVDQLILKGGR